MICVRNRFPICLETFVYKTKQIMRYRGIHSLPISMYLSVQEIRTISTSKLQKTVCPMHYHTTQSENRKTTSKIDSIHFVCPSRDSFLRSRSLPFCLHFRGLKTNHDSTASFINPLLSLQRFVSTPILSERHSVFSPSEEEVEKASAVFSIVGEPKSAVKFVGSYADGGQVPDMELPEVCFIGRSNVGKSSLIRCLLHAHEQVKVKISSRPGHTKTVNLFRVGSHFMLVDMPGYGHNMPRNFQQSVETYLTSSRRLCRTFLLVDGKVGMTSTDLTALDMLRDFGIPYVVVLTKIDKAGSAKLVRNLLSVIQKCDESAGHTCFSQPFLVSSHTGDGILLLQTFIAYITGCIQVKNL